MILHGYNVFAAQNYLIVWYEHFQEMHYLHGCNVFVVDPKIFMRNEQKKLQIHYTAWRQYY